MMNFNVKIEGPINGLKHTDFVIVSESGKEIPCHKFVLAMKSTVFEAMLDMQDSKEVLTGRVQINDASDEALEMMVSYIYNTDIQIQDEDIYQDLLVLSNKYNLKKLADNILPKFMANIDVDNCIDAYVVGFQHEYEMIKEVAFNIIVFIWERLKKEESSKLKQLSKSYPKEYENLDNKIKNFDYSGSVRSINSILHINNCIEAFIFGFQQKHDRLKRLAFNFIRDNWNCIQTQESRLNLLSSIVGLIKYQNLIEKFGRPAMSEKEAFTIPMRVSTELAEVIGLERASRTECVMRLQAYIKEKKLQDPENKQFIIPDSKMAKIFGVNKMKGYTMFQHLRHHLFLISDFDLL